MANRTVRSDDGSDVILDNRLVLRFVLRIILDRCCRLQPMKHPIDDDPPDDWHRQAGNDEEDFLDQWGHFYAKNQQGIIVEQVFAT